MPRSSDPRTTMRRWSRRQTASGAPRWGAAVASAVGVLVLASPTTAMAQQYPPSESTLSVSDTTLAPGEEVTIGADGYAAGTAVTNTFESEPVTIGRVQASSAGAFTTKVRIPADASPGKHTLKATGLNSDGGNMRVASAAVTISGTSAAPGAQGATNAAPGARGSTGSRGIAFTGLQTFMLSAVATGVLATGIVLVAMARRRRAEGGATA